MAFFERFLWVDLGTVVAELQGRGPRTPKLVEIIGDNAVFAQTDETNRVLTGGLTWAVRMKNGKVSVHELMQALKRLGWPGAWV